MMCWRNRQRERERLFLFRTYVETHQIFSRPASLFSVRRQKKTQICICSRRLLLFPKEKNQSIKESKTHRKRKLPVQEKFKISTVLFCIFHSTPLPLVSNRYIRTLQVQGFPTGKMISRSLSCTVHIWI